jgi:hypothetical protein
MKVLDFFKREIKVGDFVAKASLSWKRAYLIVGRVTNITEKGNVTIDQVKPEYEWQKKIVSVNGRNILILPTDRNTLPESFTSLYK